MHRPCLPVSVLQLGRGETAALGWECGGAADTMVLGQGHICCQGPLHRWRVNETSFFSFIQVQKLPIAGLCGVVDSCLFHVPCSATKSGNMGRLFLTVMGSEGKTQRTAKASEPVEERASPPPASQLYGGTVKGRMCRPGQLAQQRWHTDPTTHGKRLARIAAG